MSIFSFTKRPKTVEAIPWLGTNAEEVRKFCVDEDGESVLIQTGLYIVDENYRLFVEGNPVKLGEWIVREKGQFSICDAQEFLEDYAPKNI